MIYDGTDHNHDMRPSVMRKKGRLRCSLCACLIESDLLFYFSVAQAHWLRELVPHSMRGRVRHPHNTSTTKYPSLFTSGSCDCCSVGIGLPERRLYGFPAAAYPAVAISYNVSSSLDSLGVVFSSVNCFSWLFVDFCFDDTMPVDTFTFPRWLFPRPLKDCQGLRTMLSSQNDLEYEWQIYSPWMGFIYNNSQKKLALFGGGATVPDGFFLPPSCGHSTPLPRHDSIPGDDR